MIDHADNVIDLNAILHPGSVYDHPCEIVADPTLSSGEKRAILASWASDAAAVASNLALRERQGSQRSEKFTASTLPLTSSTLPHAPAAVG